MREAFAQIMNDPDVVAEAQKKGLDPNFVSGDELEGSIKELVALPADVITRMKTLMEK
jgi:tripartite-type tricarboxylate transporter receptor subunit TctC